MKQFIFEFYKALDVILDLKVCVKLFRQHRGIVGLITPASAFICSAVGAASATLPTHKITDLTFFFSA